MTDEADRYLLPEVESRRIFAERIVPQQMAGRTPQAQPVVVFLIGQPGAGKSRVGATLAEALNDRGGFVDVDSDLYKPYHPAYDELMARDDTLMAAYTRADGRRWMALAHQHVRAHRLDALIQETSQDAGAVAETMSAYRAAGFRIEAVAMGVPAAMSNQRIVHRYHEQVRDRGSGRLTVQSNADRSFRSIIDLAHLVDDRRLADFTGVFRPGEGQPRYSNSCDEDGHWRHPPAFAAAIDTERRRAWTAPEVLDFEGTQARLRAEMGSAWTGTLDRIDHQR